ncbi:MAG: transketolase, partial [Cetobacterium sp.]
ISTGSLGQGLSVANGMALSARISNEDYRTYILMGDGELQEGQVWEAFGWNVIKIDGHDFDEIFQALDAAKKVKGMSTVIIANTVKGKGVSFMENVCGFHGVAPTAEETVRAVAELEKVSEI